MNDDAQAIHAAIAAYGPCTHKAGESEGLLIDYGDGPIFAARGTEFDGSMIFFGDALIDGLAYPWKHDVLGWCHKGFLVGRFCDLNKGGAIGLYWKAAGALHSLPSRPIIAGHSKGGAEAVKIGAMLAYHGHPPKAVITCGCPKGFISRNAEEILAAHGVPVRHHVIDGDPVPNVPKMPYWSRPGEIVMHPRQYQTGVYNHRSDAYRSAVN